MALESFIDSEHLPVELSMVINNYVFLPFLWQFDQVTIVFPRPDPVPNNKH
jgi:hypothetical protein